MSFLEILKLQVQIHKLRKYETEFSIHIHTNKVDTLLPLFSAFELSGWSINQVIYHYDGEKAKAKRIKKANQLAFLYKDGKKPDCKILLNLGSSSDLCEVCYSNLHPNQINITIQSKKMLTSELFPNVNNYLVQILPAFTKAEMEVYTYRVQDVIHS